MMREIISGIFTWPWFSEPHGYNFNGYLVSHSAGNLCIDPVQPDGDVLEKLARKGVARVLLTNRNHLRAANQVRTRTRAHTALHPADAAYAREQGGEVDDELRVGNRIEPMVVVGVPGKSPGECAFHWPERRILVVGDAVIGNPPGHLSLLPERVMDDPARLRESIKTLLDLDFDTLLVGDGESILQGAKDRLRELVSRF